MTEWQSDLLPRIQSLAYPRQAGTWGEERAFLELAGETERHGLKPRLQTFPVTTFEIRECTLRAVSPVKRDIQCAPVGLSGSIVGGGPHDLIYTEMGADGSYQADLAEKIALVFEPVRLPEYGALVKQEAKGVVIIGRPGRPANHFCVPISYVERWGQLPAVSVTFDEGLWLAKQDELRVSMTVEQTQKQSESRNLIVSIHGSNPTLKNIVVGAHFDTVQDVPGAQDNLAACVLMVDLAREFAEQSGGLDLHFVWFGAEELGGLEGSFRFVQEEVGIVSKTQCMVNLDGTGGVIGTNRIRVMGNETVGRMVRRVASSEKARWHVDSGCYWSDGIPFCEAGIPAINVFRDGGTETYVHSPLDDPHSIGQRHLEEYYRFVRRLLSVLRTEEIPFERRVSQKLKGEMGAFYRRNLGIQRPPKCAAD